MNMREQFEARFPTPAGVEWDEANQCYKCKVPSPYLALWMGWTAAQSTTCPGHGRSECVSCCWPTGDAPSTVNARIDELANLLTLAKAYVPVTDPLRGLINANLMQHRIEQGPRT